MPKKRKDKKKISKTGKKLKKGIQKRGTKEIIVPEIVFIPEGDFDDWDDEDQD